MKHLLKGNSSAKSAIIFSSIILIITFMIGFSLASKLIGLLEKGSPFALDFIQTSPSGMFITSMKITVLISIYLALPGILGFLFHKNLSKKLLINLVATGIFLSFVGILAAYYVFIPLAMYILLGFNTGLANINIDISSYISFCLQTIILSCIAFELPLIIYVLNKFHILNHKKLLLSWKPILIGATIFSVIINSQELYIYAFSASMIFIFYLIILFFIDYMSSGIK